MDATTLKSLSEIYTLVWSSKYKLATEKVEPLLKKHPVFSLIYCEIATSIFLLSDKKSDFSVASKRIATIRKDCASLWKARKPALKSYMASYGELKSEEINVNFEDLPSINCEKELINSEGINLKHVASALWSRCILAELNFMDSAMKFREQKYLKGMIDFKKSWNYFKECNETLNKLFRSEKGINEIPQLSEIRCIVDFGVGLYHFMCSVVPKHFLFIVEGIGFKADRTLAMEELKRSMKCESGIRSHAASLALGWIYAFFYYNYDVANQIITMEADSFPESAVVLFTSAYILRKQGKIEEATDHFLRAKECAKEIPQFQLKIEYELGTNHFLLHEWSKAVGPLTKFLENTEAEAFRTYCAYQIAFCHIMLDDKTKVNTYVKKIGPWVRKNYALDEYAGHQAKRWQKNKFTEFEKIYQHALLSQEACNFDLVLEILDKAKEHENNLGDTARSCALRGSALSHLKRYDEAIAAFKSVTEKEKDVQKTGNPAYSLPFSFCGLTEIAIVTNDVNTAVTNLKKAKAYANYEFETILGWRLRKCEDDIKLLQQ